MPPDAPVITATFRSLPMETSLTILSALWIEGRSGPSSTDL